MTLLKKTNVTLLAATTIALSACGGGGGGGGGGNSGPTGDLSSLSSADAKAISQTSFLMMRLLFLQKYSLFGADIWVNANNSENAPTPNASYVYATCTTGDVSVLWTTNDNDLDAGDTVAVTYNSCEDSGTTINGTIVLNPTTLTSDANGYDEAGSVVADVDTITNTSSFKLSANGTYGYNFSSASGDETCTYSGQARQTNNLTSSFSEVTNFVGTFVDDGDETYNADYRLNLPTQSGQVTLDVDTTTAFLIPNGSPYPTAGRQVITGKDADILQFSDGFGNNNNVDLVLPIGSPNRNVSDQWDNYGF